MDIPTSLRRAVIIWAVAVTAGVIESILAVIQAAGEGSLSLNPPISCDEAVASSPRMLGGGAGV